MFWIRCDLESVEKLALWLSEQEREADECWSIAFIKMMALTLIPQNLEVLVIFVGVDPGWAAVTLPSHESARRIGKLLGSTLDAEWIVGSAARWDAPRVIAKEIQHRLAAIINEG